MNAILKNIGVRTGFLLATYYAIVSTAVFFIDKTLLIKPALGFVNILVVLAIGTLAIVMTKNRLGGRITFREAFTPYLITIAIGLTFNAVLYYILFTIIDPSAKLFINERLLEMGIQNLQNSGLPEEQIQEQIEKAKSLDTFSFRSQLFSLAGTILRSSIGGLLLAAIFKNKSEFETVQAQPVKKR